MRILILGGTQFIGRRIVECCLDAGHQVSILTRGQSPDELPASVERLRGDRDLGPAGIEALKGRRWDACVDVSGYTAVQVRASAELLQHQVDHYTFISTASVYGAPHSGPVDESFPRVEPMAEDVTALDGETYGRLKVTCEDIVESLYPGRFALLRPQVVVGPRDPTARYAFWVLRAEKPGMLAPGDGSDMLQVIDVADVARFALLVLRDALVGPYNLAGPRISWASFLKLLGAREPVWVDAQTLASFELSFRDFPLYRSIYEPRRSLMHVSSAKAQEAGLQLTEPADTLRAFRQWTEATEPERVIPAEFRQEQLSAAKEAQIIEAFLQKQGSP